MGVETDEADVYNATISWKSLRGLQKVTEDGFVRWSWVHGSKQRMWKPG